MNYPAVHLRVNELICLKGERPLFQAISFSLKNGELLLLEGPNGIGKTTCLRTLVGLAEPASGAIEWQEQALKPYSTAYLQQMVYIGQHAGLKSGLTAYENIEQSLYLAGHRVSPKEIKEALSQVGLALYAEIPCSRLSSGQQRRVNWARLLLMQVPLWILDEPLTALDKEGVEGMQTCLKQHQKKGGCAVLTSHQALAIATHTLILRAWK